MEDVYKPRCYLHTSIYILFVHLYIEYTDLTNIFKKKHTKKTPQKQKQKHTHTAIVGMEIYLTAIVGMEIYLIHRVRMSICIILG